MGSNSENNFRYELPIELMYHGESVEDAENLNEINVYPNPASSQINVASTNMRRVDIYNGIGQLIYSQEVDDNEIEISTDSWSNGLYYINIETKEGVKSSQKVIVNK